MSLKNVPLLFFLGASRLLYLVHLSFPFVYLFTPSFSFSFFFTFTCWDSSSLTKTMGSFLFFLCIDARESLRNSKHRLISSHTFLLFLHSLYISNCWYMLNMHTNIVIVLQLERQGEVWEREIERFFEGENEGHTCNCLMSACSTPCPHADKHNHCILHLKSVE